MSNQINSKRQFLWKVLVMTSVVVIASFGLWSCKGPEVDKAVIEAYELRMNGKVDEAYAMLNEVVSEDPTNALAKYELARSMLHYFPSEKLELNRVELVDKLQELVESAIDLDPDNPLYYPFANVVYEYNIWFSEDSEKKADCVKKQYEMLQKMVVSNPDEPGLMISILVMYLDYPDITNGDETTVENYVKKIEEADEVLGVRARSMIEKEQTDEIGRWLKLAEKYPEDANVKEFLSFAYMDNNEDNKAFKCINEAIKMDPGKGGIVSWLMRGLVFKAQENQESDVDYGLLAEELASTYLETEPPTPLKAFILGCLSRISEIAGDEEKADTLWKEAIALDPYTPIYPLNPPVELFTPLVPN